MAMVRKQIYLDAPVDKALKAEAKRRRLSQAAIIREKLDSPDPLSRRPATSESARQEALTALRRLYKATEAGPGAARKFRREDAYAERLNRVRAR